MGNQFNARMIWHRREVWTYDETTGAYARIKDTGDGSERPFEWLISVPGKEGQVGRAKSEQAARNAVRSRVVRLPARG